VNIAAPKTKSPASKERLFKLLRVKYLLQILKERKGFQPSSLMVKTSKQRRGGTYELY